MLDRWFGSRDNEQRVRQRANDILKLLSAAEARLHRKLEMQRTELRECDRGEFYKKCGDTALCGISVSFWMRHFCALGHRFS